jgi:serine/threonine protein kinase
VKRTEIAVRGAPPTDVLRLELNGSPSEDGLVLEFLHDERQTGTLARVLGGQIGLGEISVPLAVKLQRDVALSQEDRGSVAAKFDKERNVHRRLQDSPQDGQGRIVRQLEIWNSSASQEADSLEPCILCARARHGLAPRCPECRDPEAVLEELQLTDDRGLRCSRCQRQFWSTPKTREAILDASLRRDPACQGCPLEHSPHADGCRNAAVFLTFFSNRVLLLERLDLDLDDYLRWNPRLAPPSQGGEKGGAVSSSRPAARQAFEVHRQRLDERRNRLQGPSVAKIADLLTVVDLFSEVLAGVEHLHCHGVAHLDLKPANICVRFRGADLDVKVIDLGLSDDPNTLTYLRQAEGPLSLWTDYSAPEFRKPRARPVRVDGRFREDACELDWPRPETPALDVPVAGDVLFFENGDLARQRFRVVHVRPSRDGWLLVQARAEPQYRLWVGETQLLSAFGPEARAHHDLEVVLEKHCGFPADVYSLGMLLVAFLTGSPDVGDFREALPGIQIELEEHLRDCPSPPSRALVHKLLGKASKHLYVFHSYAHRLAAFGVGQPLAEELLGLVLRATLRGDTRVFYLADRGGDARAAMKRFRADLDAVRTALRNALTAAQAVAVREARLTVLDQLRARLMSRPAQADSRPRYRPESRLLYPALDLGLAGDEYRASELAYLPSSCPPASVLERWERDLSGQTGGRSTAVRGWDFLVRYCRRLDLNPASAAQFLERYHGLIEQVVNTHSANEPTQAEERDRVLLWVDEFQPLVERLEAGPTFLARLEEFLPTLKDRLLTPWGRALKTKVLFFFRRHVVHLPLNHTERSAIRDAEMESVLQGLETAVQQGMAAGQQRARDFSAALEEWRSRYASPSWLDGLVRLEADALYQRQQVEECCAVWLQGWESALRQLRACLRQIRAVLGRYDPLLSGGVLSEEVTLRLTRAQREAIDLRAAEAAALWLQRNWPAPSERVEALFALWELGV